MYLKGMLFKKWMLSTEIEYNQVIQEKKKFLKAFQNIDTIFKINSINFIDFFLVFFDCILFKETCLNDWLLPNYTHTHIRTLQCG